MDNVSKEKPCGNHHPLPCGLDIKCEVPVRFFEADESDGEVVEKYRAAIE